MRRPFRIELWGAPSLVLDEAHSPVETEKDRDIKAGLARGRYRRALANPWIWAFATAAVRLAVLASLPATAHRLAVSSPASTHPTPPAPSSTIGFLQSRALLAPLTEDEHEYDEIGRNVATGRGFVLDSKWMITTPGQPVMYAGFTYPAFLGLVYWLFGAGNELPVFLIQIGLAAGGAWWVAAAGSRVRGRDAGAIAGAFYTFHPTLIWASLAMMSESICVPLVAVLMYALAKRRQHEWRRILVLGVVLALLCLDRSNLAYFVWIVAGLLFFEARKRPSWPARLAPAVSFLAVVALVIAPWTVRNYVHWKRVIPLSTKAGVNAWVHNHPGLKVELGPGVEAGKQPVDVFDPSIQDLPDEPARNSRLMHMFLGFVSAHPAKFLGLVFMRFLIAILPMTVVSKSLGSLAAAWYSKGTVLVAGAAAAPYVRRRTLWRIAPWLAFAGYWTGMQALAGAGLRFRIPADPVWTLILGVLCSVTIAHFRSRRARNLGEAS